MGVPLWSRQIPYTMMKFSCFERTVEALYANVVPKPRDQCTKGEQLVVTFAAGYIAGVFCAIVSHPADTIVSKLNQKSGSTAMGVAKELGFAGLWKGLFPRIIMIGTLTALQWLFLDYPAHHHQACQNPSDSNLRPNKPNLISNILLDSYPSIFVQYLIIVCASLFGCLASF